MFYGVVYVFVVCCGWCVCVYCCGVVVVCYVFGWVGGLVWWGVDVVGFLVVGVEFCLVVIVV